MDGTGSGTWEGAACSGGIVTIAGLIRDDSLHLELVYRQTLPVVLTTSRSVHIDAALDGPGDMRGTARNEDGATGAGSLCEAATVGLRRHAFHARHRLIAAARHWHRWEADVSQAAST